MDEFAQADADMPLDAPGRRRLPVLLRRAWYGLNQAFRRRIAGMGLTPDQFTVIRTLLEAEPDRLTQKALANAMSSDPNTIASLLERMEANGLDRLADFSARPRLGAWWQNMQARAGVIEAFAFPNPDA